MICPGIDLGTTYSMIAYVNAQGVPSLFPDAHDANLFRTPSLAYVGREGCLVGQPVEDLLADTPELKVARFAKAGMGRGNWRYLDHLDRAWTPEAISALILKKMMRDAAVFAHEEIGPAVITVPAQFTDEQRRATLAAADLAGLSGVHLIEEPVAAATFYGIEQGMTERTLLVYDFGGGTFDVTVLQASPKGLYALATDGDPYLGGRTLDERISNLAGEDYARRHGRSPLTDAGSAQRLRRLAEDAKIRLGRAGQTHVQSSLLLLGQPFDFVLAREQFDRFATEIVARTITACDRALSAAGLGWRDIDKVLLTGGSSLLPQVARDLMRVSGKPADDIISRQPHQAVAFGAAIAAARRAGSGAQFEIRHATTADLCLRVWDRQRNVTALETLVAKNRPLPAEHTRAFFTSSPDQTRLVLQLVQRRGDPAEEFVLGSFSFGPILSPRANYPVEVTASVGRDGLVKVTARDPATGRQMEHVMVEGGGDGARIDPAQRELVSSVAVNG
jgi:molecular chaperone DnaK